MDRGDAARGKAESITIGRGYPQLPGAGRNPSETVIPAQARLHGCRW